MTVTSTPPGIPSAPRLADWIGESLGGEPAELTDIQLIAGGRSNLTYRLAVSGSGGDRQLVLRRPPLGHVLPTAHDMSREFRVLAGLGRGAGYLARQLSRWQRQWELSNTREVPGYDELVARLTATLPPEGETTLVHGDFRLDNVLVTVSPRPRIAAVVDWEMATLGDPLADLGLTLVYWTDPGEEGWLDPASGEPGPGLRTDGTTSPGFLTRAEFAAGYARRTGRDISRIGYYVAFGYFKLAVVLEGIYARYLQHQTVGEGFEHEGLAVPALVARAHQVLDADD